MADVQAQVTNYKPGFVRFLVEGKEESNEGCGFLISENHLCTCAHVVNLALGRDIKAAEPPKDQDSVSFVFPFLDPNPVKPLTGTVVCWRPPPSDVYHPSQNEKDIAILEIAGTLPAKAYPLPVMELDDPWDNHCLVFGYPEDKPTGVPVKADTHGTDQTGLIQMVKESDAGYLMQPGFSGAPVWDENARRVIGIIDATDNGKRVAYAIPIKTVNQVYQEKIPPTLDPEKRLKQFPPNCPPGYTTRVGDFIDSYLGSPNNPKPFGGRGKELDDLNRWLENGDSDRLLITAPAGRGKTSLLIHWAAKFPPNWRVIFVPISIRRETNRPEVFLHALEAYLAEALGAEFRTARPGAARFNHRYLLDLLDKYAEYPKEPLVILLDGLDEAATFSDFAGLFPSRRLKNIKLVVSARLTVDDPTAYDWLERLEWQRMPHCACLDVPGLDVPGVEDVLREMGCPLDQLADKSEIVSQLHHLTEGDPLLVGLYVEDLWFNKDHTSKLTPEDLQTMTPGFGGYFKKWFTDQEKLCGADSLFGQQTIRVLAIMACALGPLRSEDIVHLAQIIHSEKMDSLPLVLKPLARFVVGNPDSDGYVLNHPKIGYFLSSPNNGIIIANTIQRTQQGFLTWGRSTIEGLNNGDMKPDKAPQYLLLFYIHHLQNQNEPLSSDLLPNLMALVDTGWHKAWNTFEGGDAGFANNVTYVLEVLQKATCDQYHQDSEGKIHFFGERIRCVLCLSSIRSAGRNISADLLNLGLKSGFFTDQHVLNIIDQKTDELDLTESMAAIAGILRKRYHEKALAMARGIRDERSRSMALTGLAPYLSAELQRDALDAVKDIEREYWRAPALTGLAPHLPKELMGEALSLSKAFLSEMARATALTAMAPHLPEELMGEALSLSKAFLSEMARATALTGLAPHLSEEFREEIFSEALSEARQIENENFRATALTGLAPHLPPQLQKEVLVEALSLVRGMRNEGDRATAMTGLAPYLTKELLTKALFLIRFFRNEGDRATAMTGLAPCLPKELLNKTLSMVLAFRDERCRALALIDLAPHWPTELNVKALPAARGIGEKGASIPAMIGLAPYLPIKLREEVLDEALPAVRGIDNERVRAIVLTRLVPCLQPERQEAVWVETLSASKVIRDSVAWVNALKSLAPHLPAELQEAVWGEALSLVRGILNERDLAKALTDMAPCLPMELQAKALSVAKDIGEKVAHIKALIGLVPFLPPQLQEEVLVETLTEVKAIENLKLRTEILTLLAPQLPAELLLDVWSDAISAAGSIKNGEPCTTALTNLAPHLPKELLRETLDAARLFPNDQLRTEILTLLAPQLPAELQLDVWSDAISAAGSIENDELCTKALIYLAPHLPVELQEPVCDEALYRTKRIQIPEWRAEALTSLAPHLPAELQREVLVEAIDAARGTSGAMSRAEALTSLAPHLPAELQREVLVEALETARGIRDDGYRAKALIGLAPHLPEHLKREAIEEWLQIAGLLKRSDALKTLSDLLDALSPLIDQEDYVKIFTAIRGVSTWWP